MRMRAFLSLAVMLPTGALAAADPWYCNSPLDTFGDDFASPYAFELRLNPDGSFDAAGAQDFGSLRADFTWRGSWVDHDGQLALIGTKTYGGAVPPEAEMRAYSQLAQTDILILTAIETSPFDDTLRCLRTLLE